MTEGEIKPRCEGCLTMFFMLAGAIGAIDEAGRREEWKRVENIASFMEKDMKILYDVRCITTDEKKIMDETIKDVVKAAKAGDSSALLFAISDLRRVAADSAINMLKKGLCKWII